LRFLNATINQIGERLPLDETGILIVDAFSLNQLSSLGKIHQLAMRFSNIIDANQLTRFGHEIENLDCNLIQIKKLFESNPSGNWLNIWRSYQESYPLFNIQIGSFNASFALFCSKYREIPFRGNRHQDY